jgi:glycosyltransferase involved in cell wall biosynthesis
MRVLIVSNKSPAGVGGIERYLTEISRAAQTAGTSLDYLYLPTPAESSRRLQLDTESASVGVNSSIELSSLDMASVLSRYSKYAMVILAGSAPMFLFRSMELQALLDHHASSAIGALLFPFQELEYYFEKERVQEFAKAIISILHRCAYTVVPSRFSEIGLLRYSKVSLKYGVVPLGGSESGAGGALTNRGNLRSSVRLQSGPRAIAIGQLGAFTRHKNLDSILSAWAIVRREVVDAQLILLGSGTESLGNEKVGIVGLGIVSDGERRFLLGHCHCLVQASSVEAFGLTTVEALSRSIPVVGFDAGSTSEIVTDGYNGILVSALSEQSSRGQPMDSFPLPSVSGLSEAILRMFCEPALRNKLSGHGAASVSQFTWMNTWSRYCGLLRSGNA